MADQASPRDQVVPGSTVITVYNGQPSLVRELREVELQAGEQWIVAGDLSPQVDMSSVLVSFVGDLQGATILEQTHPASDDARPWMPGYTPGLNHHLNHLVEIFLVDGETIQGKLLSTNAERGIWIEVEGTPTLIYQNHISYIQLIGASTEGMLSLAQMRIRVQSAVVGRRMLELTYLASGISWSAEYAVVFVGSTTRIEGLALITNLTGKTYSQATLRLLIGSPNRSQAVGVLHEERARGITTAMRKSAEQEDVSEYKLFTLPNTWMLANGQTHHIPLIGANIVSAKSVYLYESLVKYWGRPVFDRVSGQNTNPVDTVLEFSASRENGFTTALPRGRVRVYQEDEAGIAVLVGEDNIGNTAQGELVRVKLGSAFDLKGEQVQKSFEREGNRIDETMEITLHNYKTDGETVEIKGVQHPFRSSEWELLSSSHPAEQVDAETLEFTIPVPAQEKTTMRYTVRYHMPPEERR